MARFLGRSISAWLFLTASAKRLRRRAPEYPGPPAWAMMLLGVAWGGVLIGLWNATSHLVWLAWPGVFNWIIPSVACAMAITLGPYRRASMAMIETITSSVRRLGLPARAGRRPTVGNVAGLVTLTAVLAAIINHAFSLSDPNWSTQLSPGWAWLWPRAGCRVLLLAPVWGAWSMVVLGQFHRPDKRTDLPTRRFAEAMTPLSALYLAVPLAGSLVFLGFLYPWHFVPPAAAVASAIGGGTLIVRLHGGLCRQALLASNLLTQLAFLAACLVVR